MTPDDLLPTFRARAEALGVRVERVSDVTAAAAIIAAFAAEIGAARPIIAAELNDLPALMTSLTTAGLTLHPAGEPSETRDAPLGISLAHLAIAETGSVLLAEPALADRAIGMLAATHLIICCTADLVASLHDAAAALRAVATRPSGGYATLVTGPSRTADIERVLTVGVQGPGRVVVVFVDDLA